MALLMVAACTIDQPGDSTGEATLWPDGAIADFMALAGPEAYGWQRCVAQRIRFPGGDELVVTATTAVFDPVADRGFLVTEIAYWELDENQIVVEEWLHSWADGHLQRRNLPSPTRGAGWEPGSWHPAGEDHDRISIEQLRRAHSIDALFDFESLARDTVDPANTKPEVQEIPLPPGADVDRRLEGVPDGRRMGRPGEGNWLAFDVLDGPRLTSRGLWAIDLWVDDDRLESGDAIERIRVHSVVSDDEATEIRFIPAVAAIGPTGLTRPDCPDDPRTSTDWLAPLGWDPTRSVPLKVSLDPDGRPYDYPVGENGDTTREPIGQLAIPDGEMLVMDGSAIQFDPAMGIEDAAAFTAVADEIRDDGVHLINLEVVSQVQRQEDGNDGDIVAVWVGPTDARVVSWDASEHAYRTDFGGGGIVPAALVELPAATGRDGDWIPEPNSADYALYDLDATPGPETFLYWDGWRSGPVLLSRGRDAEGEVVVVVIRRPDYPWRLAFPDGRPPADITRREDELIECMEGTRPISPAGWCEHSEAASLD